MLNIKQRTTVQNLVRLVTRTDNVPKIINYSDGNYQYGKDETAVDIRTLLSNLIRYVIMQHKYIWVPIKVNHGHTHTHTRTL